jgi:hypothetical protein
MVQQMGVFHEELTQTPKPCPVATCRELLAC